MARFFQTELGAGWVTGILYALVAVARCIAAAGVQHPAGCIRLVDPHGADRRHMGLCDRPGFRCGTCHEYPAFDPVAQESLPLRIRPLVVMECSVIDSFYLGLGLTEAAQEKMQMLKERCRQVSGIFTFLWHNSSLNDNESRLIFSSLLS